MKKKLIAIMLSFATLSLALSSCGGTDTSDIAKDNSDVTSSAQPQEIDFWHYMSEDKEGQFITQAVDIYNNSQDKVHVNAQYIPREELMKQYTIGVVSGELPDCGLVDNPDHNSYASMGVFEDITELYNDWDDANFLEGPLASCYYDDKLYGLPFGSNCLGLYYNEDLLNAAGVEVPTTWSELQEACEVLTTDTTKGLAISAIGNEEGTFQYLPWLLSAGGDVNNINSDASKESMEFLKGLIDSGYISRECVTWTQADVEKQFASGQAAMMINGPWQLSALSVDAPDLNFSVAKVPKADDGEYASALGGENIVICKGANVPAAWDFVSWLCSYEVSPEVCQAIGRFSPRADVDNQKIYADDPINGLFVDVLPTAQSRGPSPYWPEISEAIYTAEQEVFTGQKDVDTAMDDAQAKIDEINAR